MYRISLHVPLADNDGRSLAPIVENARVTLAEHFGGLTETAARGLWVSDGRTYADEQVILSVDVPWPDSPSAHAFVSILAEQVARHGRQECVYVTGHALETSFVKPL